jgi:hypothetical protein
MTMRRVWFGLLILMATVVGVAHVKADDARSGGTEAFENAYAASFYEFDACGDGIAGRTYRFALTAKVKQCPFSEETKQRFVARAAAQRRKSSQVMAKLIEDHGGLPMRLEGMTRTCREQMDSPEYRAVRSRLDAYGAGNAGVDTVVSAPCDAAEISP